MNGLTYILFGITSLMFVFLCRLLFVLLTSHMMMFYRLQQLEVLTNTVVPQYCQSHDSRRQVEQFIFAI